MASLNSYKFGDFIIRKRIRFKFLTLKLVQGFHLSVSLSCYTGLAISDISVYTIGIYRQQQSRQKQVCDKKNVRNVRNLKMKLFYLNQLFLCNILIFYGN